MTKDLDVVKKLFATLESVSAEVKGLRDEMYRSMDAMESGADAGSEYVRVMRAFNKFDRSFSTEVNALARWTLEQNGKT
jgi:hypothetical protein